MCEVWHIFFCLLVFNTEVSFLNDSCVTEQARDANLEKHSKVITCLLTPSHTLFVLKGGAVHVLHCVFVFDTCRLWLVLLKIARKVPSGCGGRKPGWPRTLPAFISFLSMLLKHVVKTEARCCVTTHPQIPLFIAISWKGLFWSNLTYYYMQWLAWECGQVMFNPYIIHTV